MGRRRSIFGILAAVAACAALAASAPAAGAFSSLDSPPPGANDFSCHPSAAHPDPVVLVHGLGATMGENWSYMSPLLKARGYCVFALTYGLDARLPFFGGVIPIEQSAAELGAFVDRVLAATGAPKVDKYVAMTPLYNGTNVAGIATLRDFAAPSGISSLLINLVGAFCGSCSEFLTGSPMVKKLNEGGAAAPGVTYTTIPTRYDELVAPWTSGLLPAPATNRVLQEVCPNDISEHVGEAFDPVVAQLVFNALDPAHARAVSCAGLPPLAPPPPA